MKEHEGHLLVGEMKHKVRNAEWFPYVQRRRHLAAGQMGVSLVRCLGPGQQQAYGKALSKKAKATVDNWEKCFFKGLETLAQAREVWRISG